MTPVAMGNFPTDFCRCSLVALYFTITDMIFRRMAVEIFCLIFKVSRMVFLQFSFFNDSYPVFCGTVFCCFAVDCLHLGLYFLFFAALVWEWDGNGDNPMRIPWKCE